jgi:acetyl esterase/lipase
LTLAVLATMIAADFNEAPAARCRGFSFSGPTTEMRKFAMTDNRTEMARRPILFETSGMDEVAVNAEIPYGKGGALTFDVYRPKAAAEDVLLPVVVFIFGYADGGAKQIFGCRLKEMESYVSWAKLCAASGLCAVTYSNEESADVHTLLAHLSDNSAALGIDASRIALWGCSGNAPMAVSLLLRPRNAAIRAAYLGYGFMFEAEGGTTIAEQAAKWGFDYPLAGKSAADLPADLPLFVVRCGRDEIPHINDSIDAFIASAIALNLPVTIANHADAPHAFDIVHDSPRTREIIGQAAFFLLSQLIQS